MQITSFLVVCSVSFFQLVYSADSHYKDSYQGETLIKSVILSEPTAVHPNYTHWRTGLDTDTVCEYIRTVTCISKELYSFCKILQENRQSLIKECIGSAIQRDSIIFNNKGEWCCFAENNNPYQIKFITQGNRKSCVILPHFLWDHSRYTIRSIEIPVETQKDPLSFFHMHFKNFGDYIFIPHIDKSYKIECTSTQYSSDSDVFPPTKLVLTGRRLVTAAVAEIFNQPFIESFITIRKNELSSDIETLIINLDTFNDSELLANWHELLNVKNDTTCTCEKGEISTACTENFEKFLVIINKEQDHAASCTMNIFETWCNSHCLYEIPNILPSLYYTLPFYISTFGTIFKCGSKRKKILIDECDSHRDLSYPITIEKLQSKAQKHAKKWHRVDGFLFKKTETSEKIILDPFIVKRIGYHKSLTQCHRLIIGRDLEIKNAHYLILNDKLFMAFLAHKNQIKSTVF